MNSTFMRSKSGRSVECLNALLPGYLVDLLAGKWFAIQMLQVNMPLQGRVFSERLTARGVSCTPKFLLPFVCLLVPSQTRCC